MYVVCGIILYICIIQNCSHNSMVKSEFYSYFFSVSKNLNKSLIVLYVHTSYDDGSSPKMRSTDQSLSLKVARAQAPKENSSLEEHHCLELF